MRCRILRCTKCQWLIGREKPSTHLSSEEKCALPSTSHLGEAKLPGLTVRWSRFKMNTHSRAWKFSHSRAGNLAIKSLEQNKKWLTSFQRSSESSRAPAFDFCKRQMSMAKTHSQLGYFSSNLTILKWHGTSTAYSLSIAMVRSFTVAEVPRAGLRSKDGFVTPLLKHQALMQKCKLQRAADVHICWIQGWLNWKDVKQVMVLWETWKAAFAHLTWKKYCFTKSIDIYRGVCCSPHRPGSCNVDRLWQLLESWSTRSIIGKRSDY